MRAITACSLASSSRLLSLQYIPSHTAAPTPPRPWRRTLPSPLLPSPPPCPCLELSKRPTHSPSCRASPSSGGTRDHFTPEICCTLLRNYMRGWRNRVLNWVRPYVIDGLAYHFVDGYSVQLWVLRRDQDQLILATPEDLRNEYIPLWRRSSSRSLRHAAGHAYNWRQHAKLYTRNTKRATWVIPCGPMYLCCCYVESWRR